MGVLDLFIALDEPRKRVPLGAPYVVANSTGFTSQNASTFASLNVASPADWKPGDLLIVAINSNQPSGQCSIFQPGGNPFTGGPNNSSAAFVRGSVWWRQLQAGDPANWTFTFAYATWAAYVAITVRNYEQTPPELDGYNDNNTGNSSNISAGSVTVNRDNSLVLHCAFQDEPHTLTAPSGYTKIAQEQHTHGTVMISTTTHNAGTTGSKTATSTQSDEWVGIHCVFKGRLENE